MELDKLRHERTQIVTECRLQLENIYCLYFPIRIRFQDNEKLFIEREWKKRSKKETNNI